MRKMLFTLAMLLVAVMANAKDIKTVVLTTNPIMHCANCEAKIKENLKFCKGIKSVETSVENQTVTIQYDADKASPETYIASLKKANYVATEKKACAGKSCDGKKSCAGEQKSCCKESGEKKCDGKCKGEAKCEKKCEKNGEAKCEKKCEKKCEADAKTGATKQAK